MTAPHTPGGAMAPAGRRRQAPVAVARTVALAVVLAVALAVVAAGCAISGAGPATDAGPAPTRPVPVTAASAGTGTAPVGTAAPGAGAGLTSGPTTTVSVWLTRAGSVEAVRRAVPAVSGIGARAVRALLDGPTGSEAAAGLGSAVPPGTRLLGLIIDKGVARVDMSGDFEAGGSGDRSLVLRLAQVTCTLGQFPTVDGVRFSLDGSPVGVLAGDGSVVDRPVTCDGYRQALAPSAPSSAPPDAPGIWPYTTAAEGDAAAGPSGVGTPLGDAPATAVAFAARWLGMSDAVAFDARAVGPRATEVGVGPGSAGGQPPAAPVATTVVSVAQLGSSAAWTVTGTRAPTIVVDAPAAGARVASPVHLAGRATAFEGVVAVSVRQDGMLAGDSLGDGTVIGRGDGVLGPFDTTLAYRAPTEMGGAVVFASRSAADGRVVAASVVRVRF
ncbi:MAG: GerMN domain-containing protein [Acidimicrobiales bacterium]